MITTLKTYPADFKFSNHKTGLFQAAKIIFSCKNILKYQELFRRQNYSNQLLEKQLENFREDSHGYHRAGRFALCYPTIFPIR